MVKLNSAFVSKNNIEVVVKLKKIKKSYYDVELVWDSNMSPSYFGSVMKKGGKWEVFTNLDNYWFDYCGFAYKSLTEAIEYIGFNEIECRHYFNIY